MDEEPLDNLEAYLRQQNQYINRECYEEPPVDFRYIGQQDDGRGVLVDLYNCIKVDCKNFRSTVTDHGILEHIRLYHGNE